MKRRSRGRKIIITEWFFDSYSPFPAQSQQKDDATPSIYHDNGIIIIIRLNIILFVSPESIKTGLLRREGEKQGGEVYDEEKE